MRIIILFLAFLCTVNTVNAQKDRETAITPKTELKLADLMYAQAHYYTAIEHYKEVVREKPKWRYSRYWLAMSYLKARDYKSAEKWFKQFVNQRLGEKEKVKKRERENRLIYDKARYYYGMSLKHNGKYTDAIKQFKAFKGENNQNELKHTKGEINWNTKANIEIKGAEFALEMEGKRKTKVIQHLGNKINTTYEESSPVGVNDTIIYYSSLNKDELVFIDKIKDIPQYNIFQSKKIDGEWQKGKMMPVLNDKKKSTGNVALSEDGNRMYFTRCYNNQIDEIKCSIYFSKKRKGKWQEPIKLNKEINKPNYTSTQPSVRKSGDKWDFIYFSSDRPEGKGGMDIWYFIRTKTGNFKGPRLVKGPINTEFDEITPSYSYVDSSFYFSSNGHPGYGGFDVFVTVENEELQWEEPKNIGAPVNSTANDLYFRKQAGKTSGFFVSDRDGTEFIDGSYRGDDIYSFRDFNYGLEGVVLKEGKEKIGDVFVKEALIKLYTINEEGIETFVEEMNLVDGEYFFDLKPEVDYKIEVIKTGFAPVSEFVSTKNLLKEDTLNQNLAIAKTQIVATGSVFDEKDLFRETPLDDALVGLYEKLEGGEEKKLKIAKITELNPSFFFDLNLSKKYALKITKEGYFAKNVDINLNTLKDNADTIYYNIKLAKLELGKTYELENILYEFGKATLTDASKIILDNLSKIMVDNPTFIIELSAHTDSKGSDASNQLLSQRRAQSCVDYLISKEHSKDRLQAKGYGEKNPKASNTNPDGSDNPEGRKINRRTESKILGLKK